MKNPVLFFTIICFFQISFSFSQEKITHRLAEVLATSMETETIRAIIILEGQYPILELDKQFTSNKASNQERACTVISELQQYAKNSQKDILAILDQKPTDQVISFKGFWITNLISLEATEGIILELSNRADIAVIDLDEFNDQIIPIETKPALNYLGTAGDNLKIVNAHKMWAEGFTGEGVIVANLDTGVDAYHPALSDNWHGNNVPWEHAWFDAFQGTIFPEDPAGSQAQAGHGTGTMGVIAGIDPYMQDTIGMAFNSEWIACRAQFGIGNMSQKIECMEWIIDPDGNPSTVDDMPVVLNNSWGGGSGCTTELDMAIQAIEAAGIAVIWAAGNSGPYPSTVAAPSNQNHTEVTNFAVGGITNYDPDLPIDPWSSRGPTNCNNGNGNNIKPEITAPIVARTSSFYGEYYTGKGTSMAAPHVAGAIALLKQAFPDKTGTELKWMLYGSARDLGIPGEDNDYGMGLLDVWAAYLYQPSPEDPRQPMSVNASSDFTTTDAVTLTWTDPIQLLNGSPLTEFEIQIHRDGELIATIASATENYIDDGLTDGQLYEYQVITKDLISDRSSIPVLCSVYAGGSPYPAPPTGLTCAYNGDNVELQWSDPLVQSDGSFLDDLDQILIYRNDLLIDSVDAGVETYYDNPTINFTAHYNLVAADSESPINFSEKSEMVPCFAGDCPEYLVWVGPDALLESKYSGDSLYNTLLNLYTPVFKSDNLFEFGNDLSQHEVIFVALGNFPFMHILSATGDEAPALENFVFNGGKLYLEGGFAFDPFPNPYFPMGYDIHPWFGLGAGNEGSGDVSGILGQNALSDFTFDYIGINNYMNELNPEFSTVIWKNSQNDDICGVFYEGYGSGQAIGVTTPFGSLKSDIHTKKELMEAYLQLFDIVISCTPEDMKLNSGSNNSFSIYPNPMKDNLNIEFYLKHSNKVEITLCDAYGKEIKIVGSGNFEAGNYHIMWQADKNMNDGIYFLRLKTEERSATSRVIIMK